MVNIAKIVVYRDKITDLLSGPQSTVVCFATRDSAGFETPGIVRAVAGDGQRDYYRFYIY